MFSFIVSVDFPVLIQMSIDKT